MRAKVQPRARALLLYTWAMIARFWRTLAFGAAVLFGSAALLTVFYEHDGRHLSFPHALDAAYFMLLGQPTVEFPSERPWIGALMWLLPPLGFLVIADGIARLFVLIQAREAQSKEWIAVLASTMKDHVVLCGLGTVGYRVLGQLQALGIPAVAIERNGDGPFVGLARNSGVAIIHDDARSPEVLRQANVEKAQAVICCTDDDLANLDVALDARSLNPGIRVVLRMFDDNLARKVEGAFGIQVAFSTSALAAPAFAMAALDPAITHGFYVGQRLHVVAALALGSGLGGTKVGALFGERGASVLEIVRGGQEVRVTPDVELQPGDRVVLQAPVEQFKAIRGECSAAPRARDAA